MVAGVWLELTTSGSRGLILLVTLCLSHQLTSLLVYYCGDCHLCGHRVHPLGTVKTAVDALVGPLGTVNTAVLIDGIGDPSGALMTVIWDDILVGPLGMMVMPFQLHLLWHVGCCDHFLFGELLGVVDAKLATKLRNICLGPLGAMVATTLAGRPNQCTVVHCDGHRSPCWPFITVSFGGS